MTLIVGPKALLHTEIAEAIYMDDEDTLVLEFPDCIRVVQNPPANALAQIAMAEAENKPVVEFENSSLYFEKGEDE